MSAILTYHKIGYHVRADDTQLYISFKCKQPLEAISKVNSCLSDIRRWHNLSESIRTSNVNSFKKSVIVI